MADAPEASNALTAYCGIATEYWDIWGQHHPASHDTRHALLAAMHLPPDGDPAILLRDLADAEWRSPLPPVKVQRQNEAIRLPLSLPTSATQQGWRWTLHCENGEQRGADFIPAQLPHLENRRIGDIEYARFALDLPAIEATGYHRLELASSSGTTPTTLPLIVVPACCFQPAAIHDARRTWGPTVQLYGLRSRRNWGIGDYGDLRALVNLAADAGAAMVGLSPLHAMFQDKPAQCSPYSPSSRGFLNTLYLDIEAIPEFSESEQARRLVADANFQARLHALRNAELVDHAGVAAAKRELLDLLYRHFREHHLSLASPRAREFLRFRADMGEPLERLARFEALQEHFSRQDNSIWGWPVWPAQYRDPSAPAVAEFAAAHKAAVTFFAWLQWLADCQLAEAASECARRGLGIGLYRDLALGANPGGAEVWAWQQAFALGAYAGAPADEFNPKGQDWGLPPLVPQRLRAAAYAPFIEVLRANMRHAGALRIDHAMWLTRVFWVPAGVSAVEGAYVGYPFDDLLGILALESQRNHCLVIGEALGTVPEGFRQRLAEAGILSYHPFQFERRDDGDFRPPAEYPRHALVALSTHDLPTLCGLWHGRDIDTRTALRLFPSEALRENQIAARSQDRERLLHALRREGLLPEGASPDPATTPQLTPAHIEAIHRYLARTPAQVLAVQPEDVLGLVEQANVPGSHDDQHPNWRRRLPLDLERWRDDARFSRLFAALRAERGNPTNA